MKAVALAALQALTSAEAASLHRLRAAERYEPTRPAWASDDELARLSVIIDRALAPAGDKAAYVLLDRLFAVVPMPPATREGADPIDIYAEELAGYPADVLARAVSAVIRRWRWRTSPMVGDIATAADEDPEFRQRRTWRVQIRILRLRPLDRVLPMPEHAPDALEAARRYAMLEASDKHRGEPWSARAAAIVAAFQGAKAPAE